MINDAVLRKVQLLVRVPDNLNYDSCEYDLMIYGFISTISSTTILMWHIINFPTKPYINGFYKIKKYTTLVI